MGMSGAEKKLGQSQVVNAVFTAQFLRGNMHGGGSDSDSGGDDEVERGVAFGIEDS